MGGVRLQVPMNVTCVPFLQNFLKLFPSVISFFTTRFQSAPLWTDACAPSIVPGTFLGERWLQWLGGHAETTVDAAALLSDLSSVRGRNPCVHELMDVDRQRLFITLQQVAHLDVQRQPEFSPEHGGCRCHFCALVDTAVVRRISSHWCGFPSTMMDNMSRRVRLYSRNFLSRGTSVYNIFKLNKADVTGYELPVP
ncbi:hypothetical protein T11_3997 [Trichinella zimbabwensis]|uniref:Uncharacterized protein n=1 Tax=Trichinella zimbabwensis TaxID=268475 RepID=A0A0V1HW48_9BILA|nr:hypothetical protein T11_3997 [Trichinella zimbabwensis]